MERRLILDTTELIALEKGTIDRAQFDGDDLRACAVSIAEFREGVELADSDDRRRKRLAALADLRQYVDILDYTEATAIAHAKLIVFARRIGKQRGRHDLIIAAHAAETGRIIVSSDAAARFGDLPGVTAVTPTR